MILKKKKIGSRNSSVFRQTGLILVISTLPYTVIGAGTTHPANGIDPNLAAKAAGAPPVSRGNSTTNIDSAATIDVDNVEDKCTAHTKDYSEEYSKMFDKGPSLMSQCGLGKLMDFDMLKLFDPLGTLLDAMQGAVCGWVSEAYTPFQKSWNRRVSKANKWINDRNRGYSNWVDERAAAVYNTLYASYKKSQTRGLSDIGYPYDTEFSDPVAVPVGSGQGSNGGVQRPGSGTGGNVGSGSLDIGDYGDNDIIVVNDGSGPLIIDSAQEFESTNESFNTRSQPEVNPNEQLQEVFNLFKK